MLTIGQQPTRTIVHINVQETRTHKTHVPPRKPAPVGDSRRPAVWRPETLSLTRAELRAIVAEVIG